MADESVSNPADALADLLGPEMAEDFDAQIELMRAYCDEEIAVPEPPAWPDQPVMGTA